MSTLLKNPLPRLFISGARLAVGQPLLVAGAEHHYLTRVLRLSLGDRLLLLDGKGHVADARIAAISAHELHVEPQRVESTASPGALPPLFLLVGLLKGERHDLVIQKATELGAASIISVTCARSIPELSGARGDKRQQRWLRVAQAAAQQCRRSDVPRISPPLPFATALMHEPAGLHLLFSEGIAPPLRLLLADEPSRENSAPGAAAASLAATQEPPAIALLVGPEGGLTDDEIAMAGNAGYRPCSLGPHILRAETAAIAALAATTALLAQ